MAICLAVNYQVSCGAGTCKSTCHTNLTPQFDSQSPRWKKGTDSSKLPLTSTCLLWHAHNVKVFGLYRFSYLKCKPHALCCAGEEGEPGTCWANPEHQAARSARGYRACSHCVAFLLISRVLVPTPVALTSAPLPNH